MGQWDSGTALRRLRRSIVPSATLARFRLGDQPDRRAHRLDLLPELGIGEGAPQQSRILVELSEAGIALAAEQKAQAARGVTMIDAQLGARPSFADRAQTVLRGQHEVIVGLGQPVFAPQLSFGLGHGLSLGAEQALRLGLLALTTKTRCRLYGFPVLRILGIALPLRRQAALPELVVLGVSRTHGRERLLSVLRILRISNPQPFVPRQQ
jgi:hypothetical protein